MRIRSGKSTDPMRDAQSYAEWLEAARQADALSGADHWALDDEHPGLAAALMREDIGIMRGLLSEGDPRSLNDYLHQSLNRHQGDISNPYLYNVAFAGTKQVIVKIRNQTRVGRVLRSCLNQLPGE